MTQDILSEFKSKESSLTLRPPSEKQRITAFHIPPKMVYNDQGEAVEVILSYADYQTFLRFLADYVDWELLPPYLQDAVDHMLAEEARIEQGEESPTPLADILAELEIHLKEDAPLE